MSDPVHLTRLLSFIVTQGILGLQGEPGDRGEKGNEVNKDEYTDHRNGKNGVSHRIGLQYANVTN